MVIADGRPLTKGVGMKVSLFVVPLFVLGMMLGTTDARAEVRVPALVGDNMVVQQGVRVRVWGTASPGERVTVLMAGSGAEATAGADGRWQARIGPFAAGGPHTMTIAGSNTITVRNVLVGEVWVASGQSNMEWPLRQTDGADEEAARANVPEIRMFTVARAASAEPLDDVNGQWVVASPESVPHFSAVAYYFARELHRELKVPVGIVHSSWGGTPAEAWTSRGALGANPELARFVEAFDSAKANLAAAQREYEVARAAWERKHRLQDLGNRGFEQGWAGPSAGDGWEAMKLPQLWESAGLGLDGAVWFRREVDVPAGWAGKDLTLSLGAIDDFDVTYVNGTQVGATGAETPGSWTRPRVYTVPGALVKSGRNVIAVRVFDNFGGGGFGGQPVDMWLGPKDASASDRRDLSGEWAYKVELRVDPRIADSATEPVAPPGPDNPNSPTVLYNAMIAPLTPYAIRGAIWYQGESNVGRARQYRTLFPAMIADWRRAWGLGDLPFYFVQLANYLPRREAPSDSAWAELREAQLATLTTPNTGMAVAIDIGEAGDIHPRNKRDVGRRLALWALAKTYGKKIEFSGPLFQSMTVEGSRVRLRFSNAVGLRPAGGGELAGFAIASKDRRFVWARAKIDGDSVVVWSDEVTSPVAVRYAWADNPAATLVNGAGLPASPFRTDDWPK